LNSLDNSGAAKEQLARHMKVGFTLHRQASGSDLKSPEGVLSDV
jgi:hypothetical protein